MVKMEDLYHAIQTNLKEEKEDTGVGVDKELLIKKRKKRTKYL